MIRLELTEKELKGGRSVVEEVLREYLDRHDLVLQGSIQEIELKRTLEFEASKKGKA